MKQLIGYITHLAVRLYLTSHRLAGRFAGLSNRLQRCSVIGAFGKPADVVAVGS